MQLKHTTFEEFFAQNLYTAYAYQCENCKGIIDYSKVDFYCPFCAHPTPPVLPVHDREDYVKE